MQADWEMIRAIRGGARSVRRLGRKFLPKFESESTEAYDSRLLNAPFSALYEDATRTLCAKPFTTEVGLKGVIPPKIEEWKENIDNAGHDLNYFARATFEEALHMGLAFIFVDHTRTGHAKTVKEEAEIGARPYFRLIPADQMLAIYTGILRGRVFVRQIRFRDDEVTIDGFGEKVVQRVRVVTHGDDGKVTTDLYEKSEQDWVQKETGVPLQSATLAEIPIMPIIFGLPLETPFQVKPPMLDLAFKQIEHYQHASGLREMHINT